jgi:hypothetical protein
MCGFPLRVPLPADTKIPFWAGTNRKSANQNGRSVCSHSAALTWNNGRFDTAQAQLLVQQSLSSCGLNGMRLGLLTPTLAQISRIWYRKRFLLLSVRKVTGQLLLVPLSGV